MMAKANSNAVRTTITVPSDVKASMDSVKEAVNWSGVATEAFRVKLLEIESRKAVGNMNDVIERLRASKRRHDDKHFLLGQNAGGLWAKEKAEAIELERLAKFYKDRTAFVISPFDCAGYGREDGIGALLVGQMHPDDTDVDLVAFWYEALGEDGIDQINDRSFAMGFVEGAVAIWRAVATKL